MERLWAPWRMEYIEGIGESDNECVFCAKPAQDKDDENFILYRGEKAFIILNAFPYSNGHLLVAPYRHTADLCELGPEEMQEMMQLAGLGVRLLKETMRAEGFNLGMNLGRVAGAGIASHLHLHVVPRWSGDTNFMAACGETKVIPESLEATLKKLRQALVSMGGEDA